MMEGRYSTRSPAVKRLMREAQELCEPTDQYFAQPLEDNLFEWHFTIRGPLDSDFQAGVYHGRIILPVDYPMKPPSIIWLTPNGRFETNKKICLSISGHHPESWQPSWSIRTALLAIIGFMPTHPSGAIGSLDYKPEERKSLAKKSRDWRCPVCGDVSEILLEPNPESSQTSQEARELATQISFQGEKPKSPDNKETPEATVTSSISPPLSVPGVEGASNKASTNTPSSAPPNESPSQAASVQNPGNFSPWSCAPVTPINSAMPPPFLYYPWASPTAAYGEQFSYAVAQIPRFPYPPSSYASRGNANMYPSGFALPHGVGMFPCPFPPPPRTNIECNPPNLGSNIPVSVNNSSALPPNGSLSHSPQKSVVPNIPQTPPAFSTPSPTGSNLQCSPSCSPFKDDQILPRDDTGTEILNSNVAKEETIIDAQSNNEPVIAAANKSSKLGKPSPVIEENDCVQTRSEPVSSFIGEAFVSQDRKDAKTGDVVALGSDVGSDQNYSTGFQPNTAQVMDIQTISQALSKAFDSIEGEAEGPKCDLFGAVEVSQDADNAQFIGDHCQVEDSIDKSQVTDADISVSLMKKESLNESTGMEISHSELLAYVEEDDDDSRKLAVQMSDTEQRSHFESTSCSMPDLKMNQKQTKGLRHRQSASAHVPTDPTGGEQNSEQVSSGGARQRIEAVSGDSSLANHQRFPRNLNVANDAGRNANQRQGFGQVHSAYDASFFVMLGLCVTTVFIILNRLFYMVDFSDIFH